MRLLISILCLCCLSTLLAQPTNPINNTIPPSPDVAALMSNSQLQVIPQTGAPSVSIPIYNMRGVHLNLPVSLSYASSGLKVEEHSSWVGLGWSLNAGGSISRTTIGEPDEIGYLTSPTIPIIGSPDWPHYAYFDNVTDETLSIDSDPDIFNFSFGGYTGELFFDQDFNNNGKIYHSPYQDLKISATIGNSTGSVAIEQFEIITPEGVKYIFGKNDINGNSTREGTASTSQCFQIGGNFMAVPSVSVSAWQLTEIVHPYGDKIDFTYQTVIEKYTINTSETEYLNITSGGNCSDINPITCTNTMIATTQKLATIKSSQDELRFIVPTQAPLKRSDLEDGVLLDKIEHYGTDQQLIQTWDLGHSYFSTSNPSDFDDYRLRLDRIDRIGSGNSVVPPYLFDYIVGDFPSRQSKAQDHWGYYNGENMNMSLIPSTPYGGLMAGDAERSPNSTFSKIGQLEKITYPTLGTSHFEYEANYYQTAGGTTTEIQNMCASAYASEIGETELTQFTIPTAQSVEVNMYFVNAGMTPNINHSVQILDDNMAMLHTYHANQPPADLPTTFSLTAGTYYIKASSIQDKTAFILVDWEENVVTNLPDEEEVGGVRVSRKYDHDGFNIFNERLYDYTYDNNGNVVSSGYRNNPPSYISNHTTVIGETGGVFGSFCVTVAECQYKKLSSVSTTPLFYKSGINVTYRTIKESRPGNGYTVYEYDGVADEGINGFPNPPKRSNDWRRRQLKKQTHYNESDQVVDQTINTYLYEENGEYGSSKGLTVALEWERQGCNGVAPTNTTEDILEHKKYAYEPYTRESNVALLMSQERILDGVTTTTEYTYDLTNRDHIQPLSSKMTNSDGKIFKTNYDYTFTYQPSTGSSNVDIRDALLLENRILPAWRTTKEIGDLTPVQVDGQVMRYGQVSATGSVNDPLQYTAGLTIVPRDFDRYEVSWDETGTITTPIWKSQYKITDYQTGVIKPKKILVEGWADPIETTWNTKGQLITQTFIDHISTYLYTSNTNLLDVFTAVDGTQTMYTFDDLLRLKTVSNCQGATSTYTYSYGSLANKSFVETKVNFPSFGEEETAQDIIQKVFLDGLGRNIQTLQVEQAPNGNDHIGTNIVYDNQSRPSRQYEPIAFSGASNYNVPTGPFTETIYEPSPLNRPISVTPPSWYATTYSYGANTATEVQDLLSMGMSNFTVNTLNKTRVTDPDARISETFTDKRGRTILQRNLDDNQLNPNNTFTLYDDKDRVSKIIPQGADLITTPELIYHYVYHGDDLIKSKKIPDKAIENYFYNDRDLLAYRQDGKMAANGNWYGTIYDPFGRVVQEGFDTGMPGAHNSYDEATVTAANVLINNTYGSSGIELDKMIYSDAKIMLSGDIIHQTMTYDNCGRVELIEGNSINAVSTPDAYSMSYTYDDADNVRTMDESVLNDGQPMTLACRYDYDHIGRQIAEYNEVDNFGEQQISATSYTVKEQVQAMSYGGAIGAGLQQCDYTYLDNRFLSSINNPSALGMDIFALQLNYDQGSSVAQKNGNISSMTWSTPTSANQKYEFTYDYLNRLDIGTYSGIEAGRYDIDMGYDVRGNITSIERMGYDGSTMGMIDDLTITVPSGGNKITTISDGSTSVNHKPKGYKANSTNAFGYDPDGNVTFDPGRDANITYNHLNLPEVISINGTTDDVRYYYGADGVLYKKETYLEGSINTERQYVGKFEYEQGVVEQIHIPTGYIELTDNIPAQLDLTGVDPSSETFRAGTINSDRTVQSNIDVNYLAEQSVKMTAGFKTELNTHFLAKVEDAPIMGVRYNYVLKDHLGNSRAVFSDLDGSGGISATEVLSEHHYYPFGLEMSGEWSVNNSTDYNYGYNGKEVQRELDLGYLNYGARFYDPSIGRFTGVDPISDQFPHVSTYNYAENEPIANIDLWGLQKLAVRNNILNLKTPKGRGTATLTSTSKSSLVYDNYTRNLTQKTVVTVDKDGEFIGGASTITESFYNSRLGKTTSSSVLSNTELSLDENGEIQGVGREMNVAIETIKKDGIEGGLVASLLSPEAMVSAGALSTLYQGASNKGAKLGPLTRIVQAFAVGGAGGLLLRDLSDLNVDITNEVETYDDPEEIRKIFNSLKGEGNE